MPGKREGCTAGGGGHRPFPIGPNRRCVVHRQAGQNPLCVTPGMARGVRKWGRERGACASFDGCLLGWSIGWIPALSSSTPFRTRKVYVAQNTSRISSKAYSRNMHNADPGLISSLAQGALCTKLQFSGFRSFLLSGKSQQPVFTQHTSA